MPCSRVIVALCTALAAAAPLLALDPQTPLGRYSRQTWGIESGLPQTTVHSIVQTRDGFLWLATEGGLVRFDGVNFKVFDTQNTPTLKSNDILSLAAARGGALWIGTADGLTRFADHKFSTFTTENGLPSNSIWSLTVTNTGNLLVLTSNGLARYTGSGFQATESGSIAAVAEGPDGAQWTANSNGVRGESVRLPASNVQTLYADRSGRLWIGTSDGLSVYQSGKIRTYRVEGGLPGNRITAIYEDREGTVWVSTDHGIARITKHGIQRFGSNNFFAANLVLCFFEDREGDLWMGTDSGGLAVLRDGKFFTYGKREGLSNDFVRCVFQDSKGTVWVGTDRGLDRFQNGKFSTITAADGLSSNVIFSLSEDSSGDLLAGTPDGLNVLHSGHITILTEADGLPDNFVRSLYKDRDGSVWIGTRAGLTHWSGRRFITYTEADGLGSNLVGAILEDRGGNLWIGTQHGLSRYANGHFKTYTTKNGLSSNIITALYADGRGSLWIGTEQGGLDRLRSGQIFAYPGKLGLPNVIYAILPGNAGDLWISSPNGIFRVSKDALARFAAGQANTVPVTQYGTADGLRVGACSGGAHPEAWKTKDGSLWFATPKGVAVLAANRMQPNRLAPLVAIELATIDGRAVDPASLADIPAGPTRFSFQYTGLSFVSPHKVRYRYKLAGFDRNWIDAGTRRVAYYTNLPPGKYKFQVIACNNDGIWNRQSAALAFQLEPHFYQTRWFDLLVALAIALLCYLAYSWRVRQVKARFDAVLAERNRIAREIHDTLAQGFIGVSVHLEVAASILPATAQKAREQLETARELVRDSIAEARRSIWQLRSAPAAEESLASRLSGFIQQAAAKASSKLEFRVSGTHRPLPPKIERELLKIGEEAVVNAIRHADAKSIKVDLIFEPKRVKMTIADDGRGFAGNDSVPDGHFGLQGMRERAEQIDAELLVTSAPGEGTHISVEAAIH
ncbi:MAG TPA: two-component regulator propeller domain-containing protein [Bryobacteraceae bacterium]